MKSADLQHIIKKREKENKRYGLIATAIFHLIVFFILILMYIKPPYPPLEWEQRGGLIILGEDAGEKGVGSPVEVEEVVEETPEVTEEVPVEEVEEINTDPEAVAVEVPKEETPVVEEKPKEEEEKKPRRSLPNVEWSENDDKAPGETTKTGLPGSPDGGETTLTKGGNKGTEGIEWGLSGRGLLNSPGISNKSQQEGLVHLEIKVNSNGEVVSVRQKTNKSTTVHPYLVNIAKKYAKSLKFSPKSGTPEQVGFVRINFKLK